MSISAKGCTRPTSPFTLGSEAAGTVEAVGSDVTEVAPGDRVAYAMVRGSYAEYAVVPAAQLVKIPDRRRVRNRRCGDAARHDRALPDPLHVCRAARRRVPGARGRRRRRRLDRADGQGARRARLRNRVDRAEGAGRARSRRRRSHSLHRRRTSKPRSSASPAAASMSSTTRSARRRSRRASRAYGHGACSRSSASRAVP